MTLTLSVALSMESTLDNPRETLYKRHARISRLKWFYANDCRGDLQNLWGNTFDKVYSISKLANLQLTNFFK